MTALRALRESRTDVEALDLTAERLRHLKDAFTKAADDSRARADRYAEQDDADAVRSVRQDDQRAHRPLEPGPHRAGRPTTERTPMSRTRPVVRTDDARRPLHRVEFTRVTPAGAGCIEGLAHVDGLQLPEDIGEEPHGEADDRTGDALRRVRPGLPNADTK
ncbi:hypothetical protein ACIBJC_35755 [Streptomyces sp. NPDC050509]|uniref:hypothetical protein n=1 Tax=Streptomyces sp. NPDC050509 TaxID=3365620 RepID=UPI00379D3E49